MKIIQTLRKTKTISGSRSIPILPNLILLGMDIVSGVSEAYKINKPK
jgi:hypothetical protein